MRERAKINPHDDVLIVGAGGGVGIHGVQVAKLFGARVIAADISEAKLSLAQEWGADEVINVRAINDFTSEIKKTKEMNKILKKFEATNSLILLDNNSKTKIYKSLKNLPNVKTTDINHFNTFDIIKYKKLIFTESSIKELEKRFK